MAASTVAIGEALRVLFLPTSSSDDRKRADRILNEFQRTPEAWQLADELLRAAQPDQQWTQHCRMFAAQVRFPPPYAVARTPRTAKPASTGTALTHFFPLDDAHQAPARL